jgi:hypothetical protein
MTLAAASSLIRPETADSTRGEAFQRRRATACAALTMPSPYRPLSAAVPSHTALNSPGLVGAGGVRTNLQRQVEVLVAGGGDQRDASIVGVVERRQHDLPDQRLLGELLRVTVPEM